MKIIDTATISKRNTEIPLTVIDSEKDNAGLVVFVHGFKANRHEDGRFDEVGKKLTEIGISSVMMGFPGCDESKEDFVNYSLRNCLDDMDSSIEYMKKNYSIDEKRMGMIGYSMGGRLTAIYTGKHPELKCIGFFAAAAYSGFEDGKMIGEPVDEVKKSVKEKGYYEYLNTFDNTMLKMGKELIEDMEKYDPLESLRNYEGNAIVIHGSVDTMVNPRTADMMMEALGKANKKCVIIEDADHGFGAWNNRPDLSEKLVNAAADFFIEYMK